MVEKVERRRFSVTVPQIYLDSIDSLVSEGIYLSRGMAVTDAFRILFRLYDLEPFKFEGEKDIVFRVRKEPEPSKGGD